MTRNSQTNPDKRPPGALVISLDFELFWGVRDVQSLEKYGPRILGARRAIPRMLEVFSEYSVHATWAAVGFLFFRNREELLAGLPDKKPGYLQQSLSPYGHLLQLGVDEAADPWHFGASLIDSIAAAPHQEIGTHTFSHYYCLEHGQTREEFLQDLEAAQRAASPRGIKLESLVFPRNQFNADYLSTASEVGIRAYRGNEKHRIYQAYDGSRESLLRRALRLTDSYVPLSGANVHDLGQLCLARPFNVPASRFLRPYSRRLRALRGLQLRRILKELDRAAATGGLYHLWWHPHNFGADLEENLGFLRRILERFAAHRDAGRMESLSMSEVANRLERMAPQ
jgi:peptidoglycan/xylan/chitin deacetylase (PgdA/CDA1 family)